MTAPKTTQTQKIHRFYHMKSGIKKYISVFYIDFLEFHMKKTAKNATQAPQKPHGQKLHRRVLFYIHQTPPTTPSARFQRMICAVFGPRKRTICADEQQSVTRCVSIMRMFSLSEWQIHTFYKRVVKSSSSRAQMYITPYGLVEKKPGDQARCGRAALGCLIPVASTASNDGMLHQPVWARNIHNTNRILIRMMLHYTTLKTLSSDSVRATAKDD